MVFREAFGDFDGRVWLNCAHQGPIPRVAAREARRAVDWKLAPHRLTAERFNGVPARLRDLIARLVGASAVDIIPTNGASYGLHLLANGLPLESGDEVLLMGGDFPSDLLPWLALKERGIAVRIETPAQAVFTADEVAASIRARTRVLCLPWVHSFSGFVTDLGAVGRVCADNGVLLIANTTQGLGARPLDLSTTPVDAICNSGWKWLCGPYATGFCWMRPEIRESLIVNQAYWLSTLTAADLESEDVDPRPPDRTNPRRYDIFAPANFFNFVPWCAALELVLDSGAAAIEEYDQSLVARLLDGLDRERYEVSSPEKRESRSTLVFLSLREREGNAALHRSLSDSGIDVALRRGSLRVSPHFYNTIADIDRALEVLHA